MTISHARHASHARDVRHVTPPLPVLAVLAALVCATFAHADPGLTADDPSLVRCANLVYATDKTSVCFSDEFLRDIAQRTHVPTADRFSKVKMASDDLFQHPFAVMTGEGRFELTSQERDRLAAYLRGGGFLVASAGCSSKPWDESFRRQIARVLPDAPLSPISMDHAIFHTVHDIDAIRSKRLGVAPHLEGIELDGRIVVVYSEDGLNDTASVGGDCCCCGGNEILNARDIVANLLAYALTH